MTHPYIQGYMTKEALPDWEQLKTRLGEYASQAGDWMKENPEAAGAIAGGVGGAGLGALTMGSGNRTRGAILGGGLGAGGGYLAGYGYKQRGENQELSDKVTGQGNTIEELQGNVSAKEQQLGQLRGTNTELQGTTKTLKQKLQEMTGKSEQLSSTLSAKEQQLGELKGKSEQLTSNLSAKEQQLEEAFNEIKGLKNDLQTVNASDIFDLMSQVDNLSSTNAELVSALAEKTGDLQKARDAADRMGAFNKKYMRNPEVRKVMADQLVQKPNVPYLDLLDQGVRETQDEIGRGMSEAATDAQPINRLKAALKAFANPDAVSK